MVRVSVIIPNYNHERFLLQRIESVLQQTYRDFELILLDDCSADNSQAIIDHFASHPQVSHVAMNETNSGNTFRQWQKGLELAKGDYVWIAESDDYADRHFLETAMQSLEANPQAGLFFSDYHVADDAGQVTAGDGYPPGLGSYFESHPVMNGKAFAEDYLYIDNWLVNASAIVFKKEFFVAAGTSYLDYTIAGDWRMWIGICLQSDVIFCNRKLNFFRSHGNTVRSKKKPALVVESISVYGYILTKTTRSQTRLFLKNRVCELWLGLFTLQQKKKALQLLPGLLQTDPLLFARAAKKLIHNNYLKLKSS